MVISFSNMNVYILKWYVVRYAKYATRLLTKLLQWPQYSSKYMYFKITFLL